MTCRGNCNYCTIALYCTILQHTALYCIVICIGNTSSTRLALSCLSCPVLSCPTVPTVPSISSIPSTPSIPSIPTTNHGKQPTGWCYLPPGRPISTQEATKHPTASKPTESQAPETIYNFTFRSPLAPDFLSSPGSPRCARIQSRHSVFTTRIFARLPP